MLQPLNQSSSGSQADSARRVGLDHAAFRHSDEAYPGKQYIAAVLDGVLLPFKRRQVAVWPWRRQQFAHMLLVKFVSLLRLSPVDVHAPGSIDSKAG